jgi:hypothetical protein
MVCRAQTMLHEGLCLVPSTYPKEARLALPPLPQIPACPLHLNNLRPLAIPMCVILGILKGSVITLAYLRGSPHRLSQTWAACLYGERCCHLRWNAPRAEANPDYCTQAFFACHPLPVLINAEAALRATSPICANLLLYSHIKLLD